MTRRGGVPASVAFRDRLERFGGGSGIRKRRVRVPFEESSEPTNSGEAGVAGVRDSTELVELVDDLITGRSPALPTAPGGNSLFFFSLGWGMEGQRIGVDADEFSGRTNPMPVLPGP